MPNAAPDSSDSQNPLRLLDELLVTRLIVTAAELKIRKAPFHLEESIPSQPRLMLIRSGVATYQIDETTYRIGKGKMIFMPAWVRRSWQAASAAVSHAWCRFSTAADQLNDLTQPIIRQVADLDLEVNAFVRLEALSSDGTAPAALEAEGELKAILARFLRHASPVSAQPASRHRPPSCGEQGVEMALQHMRTQFASPGVLRDLPRVARLHPKYFRVLFRQVTGLTPGAYLLQIRMRKARYFQHESSMRVKETAAAVGYEDPFYFSRLYRRFWGHPPTDDRRTVEVRR